MCSHCHTLIQHQSSLSLSLSLDILILSGRQHEQAGVRLLLEQLDQKGQILEQNWIKNFQKRHNFFFQIVRPVSALLVVDVQNDFISGNLAISNCPAGQDGEEVLEEREERERERRERGERITT